MPTFSNNSGAQQEPIAFLERLKETLQKFTNQDLDSYEGQVILKDKFLSQCASHIRIKLQQRQQQDPAASLDEVVQTATKTFYNRTAEGGQGPGEGDKERDKACPDGVLPPGKSYSNPEPLKDKAQGKCIICRQMRPVSVSHCLCPTLCDSMNHSTPGLPVHHQLPE